MKHRHHRCRSLFALVPMLMLAVVANLCSRMTFAQTPASAVPDSMTGGAPFRGVLYVDSVGSPYRDSIRLTQLREDLTRVPFNTMMIQAVAYGDAFYQSAILPPAFGISNSPDSEQKFDPLGMFITTMKAEASPREVWAWIDPLLVANANRAVPRDDIHVVSQNSNWLSRNIDFKTTDLRGNMYLEPGLEAVQRHLESMIAELATNYPELDGIVIRGAQYPELEGRWGYHPDVLKAFRNATGRDENSNAPSPDDAQWCEIRRSIITEMVDRMTKSAKQANPKIKIGVVGLATGLAPATAEDFDETFVYRGALQDWPMWMAAGVVDFAVIENFQNEGDSSEAFDAWNYFTAQHAKTTGVETTIAVAGFDNISIDLLQQMQRVAEAGLSGVALAYHSDPLEDSSSKELFFRALANNVLARDAVRRQVDELPQPESGMLVAGAVPTPAPMQSPMPEATPAPIETPLPGEVPPSFPLVQSQPAVIPGKGFQNLIEPDPDALDYLRKTYQNIF